MSRIRKKEPCRGCGEMVLFIKTVTGKTITVNPEPLIVRHDPSADVFFTEDGIPVWGEVIGDAYDQFDDPDSEAKYRAYAPHKGHCPGGGRKRRVKK